MEISNSEKDYFINPDGKKLFRIIYKPNTESLKAFLFLIHGLFEHCQASYYEYIIKPLNDIGCMVVTHDHIGHGLSEGDRGMIDNFESLVRDVLSDIDNITNIPKNIPKFIYGHSMGGLIAVYAALQRDNFFTGICLEAPLLKFNSKLSGITVFISRIIAQLCPKVPLLKLNCNDFSSDLNYIEEVKNDNLRIHTGIPAKTIISLYNAVQNIQPLLPEMNTPFFIGHGDKDVLCEIEGSKWLETVAKVEDKTLITYLNGKHQLRNEAFDINKKFSNDIMDWVNLKINDSRIIGA